MWTDKTTELRGHRGREILNRLYARAEPAGGLTVLVAGFAYTLESPYLFYSRQVPYALGDDVLAIDFEYSRNPEFLRLDDAGRESWFQEEMEALRTRLRELAADRQLSFVGKSLGTTAVWQLLQEPGIRGRTLRAVWLTPGERRREITRLLLEGGLPSLVVCGAEDHCAADLPLEALRAHPAVELMVVPGADHALETPDPRRSIEHLGRYVERLRLLYGAAAADGAREPR